MNNFFLIFDELEPSSSLDETFDSNTINLDDYEIKDGAVALDIMKGDVVIVNGKVTFCALLKCALCGKGFEKQFVEDFHREYILGRDPYTSIPQVRLKREDLNQVYFKDIGIDLTDAIRETVITAIPMAPRCQEDCKGICPMCGQDLNIKECSCPKSGGSGWLDDYIEDQDKQIN